MKILQVYNHFYPCVGGIEKHLENLCLNLMKTGHTSDVCCLNTCAHSKKKLKSFENYKGIKITRLAYKDLKYYKISPKILKIIKPYDVIHVHGIGFFSDCLLLTKRIHKKPVVVSTHGGIFHTKKLQSVKNLYIKWARKILGKADKIIATSRNDYKIFSGVFKNMELVTSAFESDPYLKIKRTPVKNTLLHIGRIAKNKRVDLLINVVKHLKEHVPDVKLYVIGEDIGGLRKGLEKQAKEMGVEKNVSFMGRVKDEKRFEMLSKCEFFLSSSEYESFGLVVAEAMASGIPVIANKIEAYRNFIKNGVNGYMTDFLKPNSVAELIIKLSEKDLSKISKNAQKTSQHYDWKNVIKKIVHIYESVLI